MRLRSTESATSGGRWQVQGVSAPSNLRANDLNPPMLPEQRSAVLQMQASTGRSFEDCAAELGYFANHRHGYGRDPQSSHSSGELAGEAHLLIVMLSNPNDPVALAARDLRAVLGSMKTRQGTGVRRVALLSLRATTETSILAANVAVACALSGQRTLLIDANFASAVQHGIFRRAGDRGVSQLLSGKGELQELIQGTDIRDVSLLPIGTTNEFTAELTDRAALANSTEQAAELFDVVVVDVGEADQVGVACALGFDATIVIVQRGVAALGEARKLVEKLRSAGETTFGMIIVD